MPGQQQQQQQGQQQRRQQWHYCIAFADDTVGKIPFLYLSSSMCATFGSRVYIFFLDDIDLINFFIAFIFI
jgi:hypothetical protein